MDEVEELRERIEELEQEVDKFYRNCVEIQSYQAKLLDITEYWTEWMKNGEHLVKREAAVLALPTGLERMLIEQQQQQQQRRGGDGHHRRDRQLAANATDRMLPG